VGSTRHSSNGRTSAFHADNAGSTPCAAPRAVNSIGLENRALTPDDLGSNPRRRTKARVAELADAPASSTGALRACGFNSRLAHSIPDGLRKLDATAVRQWGMV
jgi:hypothetical protein